MTDEEDRTRVVSPNTIPVSGVVPMNDEDDDRTAVMSAAARGQALEAAALARAPLDFDLTGGGTAPPSASDTLDFDLTGGDDRAATSSHGALDIDLGTGETSIPAVAAVSAAATVATPPPAKASAPVSSAPAPASDGGMGKWIAIAITIGVLVAAAIYLL